MLQIDDKNVSERDIFAYFSKMSDVLADFSLILKDFHLSAVGSSKPSAKSGKTEDMKKRVPACRIDSLSDPALHARMESFMLSRFCGKALAWQQKEQAVLKKEFNLSDERFETLLGQLEWSWSEVIARYDTLLAQSSVVRTWPNDHKKILQSSKTFSSKRAEKMLVCLLSMTLQNASLITRTSWFTKEGVGELVTLLTDRNYGKTLRRCLFHPVRQAIKGKILPGSTLYYEQILAASENCANALVRFHSGRPEARFEICLEFAAQIPRCKLVDTCLFLSVSSQSESL